MSAPELVRGPVVTTTASHVLHAGRPRADGVPETLCSHQPAAEAPEGWEDQERWRPCRRCLALLVLGRR